MDNFILYSALQVTKVPLEPLESTNSARERRVVHWSKFFRDKLLESDQVEYANFNLFLLITYIEYVLCRRSFFWVICINMNEDSGNQLPVLLNERTVLRVHEARTNRAECEIFSAKYLDWYNLLMPPQAAFFDPYERTCHSRTDNLHLRS